MTCLYNENDPKTAAWLRELVAQGNIPAGTVDTRSIEELTPDDCQETSHFFAGIGGWPYALALAGWTDADVWTGSCPCQSFSAAGKQKGVEDERHLWPAWFRLIRECRPNTIFGEQVTGAIGHGWLDGVFADLEGEGYRCGAVVLGAHSVGAPHIRQRLFWVADAAGNGYPSAEDRGCAGAQQDQGRMLESARVRATGGVADAAEPGRDARGRASETSDEPEAEQRPGRLRAAGRLGDPHEPGSQGRGLRPGEEPRQRTPWSSVASLIPCGDGKARRVEPGIQPLVDALPRGVVPSGDPSASEANNTAEGRVMRLRGYGNAILPTVAAAFVRAFMDAR